MAQAGTDGRMLAAPSPAERRCQSRAAVLWGLGSFLVLQLAAGTVMLTWVPQWYDPGYGPKIARSKRRLPVRGERPLFVAILGSSRTESGVQGKPVEGALSKALGRPVLVSNFGLAGAGPIQELLTLRRVLADAGRPDLLLVEVLPPLLSDLADPPHELTEPVLPTAQLHPRDFQLVRRFSGPARDGLRRDWLLAWAAPCYTHRLNILRSVLPDLLHEHQRIRLCMDETGWLPFIRGDVPPDIRRRWVRQVRGDYEPTLTRFNFSPRPVSALIELLKVCQAEGINTALFVMPEGREFRSLYPPGLWPEIEQFLGNLSRCYNVPFISAREWMAEDDFLDTHHLSPRAAAVFSEQFGREALVPLLSGKATVSSRTRLSHAHN